MPRDSLGQFSLPAGTIVATGDTLLVGQHNPAMEDIAQALTNSLDRDGKGGMRAPFSMGNNRITGVAPGVDPTDAATVSQITTGFGVPIGTVLDYCGATPPTGYLFPYGQAVSRVTYADLFALIGTSFGAGDGSTTFNLPDYRGVASVGKANMGGTLKTLLSDFAATTLGAIFGTQSVTLSSAQMPSHTHSVTDPGHNHTITDPGHRHTSVTATGNVDGGGTPSYVAAGNTGFATTGITINSGTTGISIASAGSGSSHANVQPSIVMNKILKVTN